MLEFQQEWRLNEASGTKRIRTSSCCRRTVDCRVRTTMPWSHTVCTTMHDPWDARVPVHLGTTVRPQFFIQLNQFCEGRLQILVFVFRKTGLGDFSKAFSPYFSINLYWIKGWELCSWIDILSQSIKVHFPFSHFVILTQVCIFNHVFEFPVCYWDYSNDQWINPLSWVGIRPYYVIWI